MTNINLSKRLQSIADMIDYNSNVVDVGCDHGLLDIYLTLNKNCNCIATDISKNVLENTKNNVEKYHLIDKIKIICSDGLKNIDIKIPDKIVISGMGTSTILNILSTKKINEIDNLIIQSNNEIDKLRYEICKIGFYIEGEKIIFDKDKYYTIIKFKKGKKKYCNVDYMFGPIARLNNENSKYFNILYEKNKKILKMIPNKYVVKKLKQYNYLKKIKKFTCV